MDTNSDQSIFEDSYYKETQIDIWQHERKKAMTCLFIIGGIFLITDLIAMSMVNRLNSSTIIYVVIVPLIFLGLGFFAKTKPVLAVIAGIILFALVIALNVIVMGGSSIVSGFLVKGVIVFLFIKAYRHGRDASDARQNLDALG